MNNLVVVKAVSKQENHKNKKKNPTDSTNGGERKEEWGPSFGQKSEDRSAETKQEVTHKGRYILDVTVANT
ncbi:MAG: hypothetical protein ACUVRG_11320 [Ignavibacterium sp.]